MFTNIKGEQVPHCEDCYFANKTCPENAVEGEIPDNTGVKNFRCYQEGERLRREAE